MTEPELLPPEPYVDPSRASAERLERLAWLLDSAIPIPGTRFSIGLEALLGLIPVAGDAIGALLSAMILYEARQLGVSRTLQWRMGLNIALDSIVGAIPLVGDVFDLAFKSNRRNVALLRRHLEERSAMANPKRDSAMMP